MTINGCVIVGIEGSHGTGKTTLSHALTSVLAVEGVATGFLGEIVRSSPWFQEALLRGDGSADSDAFLHLISSQISQEIEGTLNHRVLVCDRTTLSTLGYWTLRIRPREGDGRLKETLDDLARWHAGRYDLVLYCEDYYDLAGGNDPFRGRDAEFRQLSDVAIRHTISELGVRSVRVPLGLSHQAKVDWARQQFTAESSLLSED